MHFTNLFIHKYNHTFISNKLQTRSLENYFPLSYILIEYPLSSRQEIINFSPKLV